MNASYAGQVTCPANAQSSSLRSQLEKGQRNGAVLFPPTILSRRAGHDERGGPAQDEVISVVPLSQPYRRPVLEVRIHLIVSADNA